MKQQQQCKIGTGWGLALNWRDLGKTGETRRHYGNLGVKWGRILKTVKEKNPSYLPEVQPLCSKSTGGIYGWSTLQKGGKNPPAVVSTPARRAWLQAALRSQHLNWPQPASVVDCRRHKDGVSDQLGPVGIEHCWCQCPKHPTSAGVLLRQNRRGRKEGKWLKAASSSWDHWKNLSEEVSLVRGATTLL